MFPTIGWEWQFTIFTPILLAASLVMGTVGTYAWYNREATGAVPFAVLMAGSTLWAFAYALQLAGANVATKVFWANVVHVGVAIVPVAWLCFTLQFTGRGHWLTRRSVLSLSTVPAVYVVLVFSNEYHRLVREPLGVEAVADASLLIFRQSFGPAFYTHAAYGYALMIAGVVLLVQLLFWSPRVYRRQVGLLLFGAFLPMATNAIHHAGFTPVPNFDLTPFSFTVTGLAFFTAIYYYRLLDLTPVARNIVVDNLREGVIVTDRHGRVVDLNDAAERLLGLSSDTIGTRLDAVASARSAAFEPPESDETVEHELVVESDGNRRFLHLSSGPIYDVRRELVGRSIVVRDVTETRELEAEVDATIERLRRSNAALETFTGVVSHDLQGPLRTTERYLSLFDRDHGESVDEDGDALLKVAHENTTRMQAMITDLLRYSRIDSSDADFTPVDCDRLLADVLETLRFDVDAREATVVCAPLPTVPGVEHQLRRLFQNLLSNALAHSGVESPEIRVTATRTGEDWTVAVSDDGVGIEPGALEHVFELYTQAGQSATAVGTESEPKSGGGTGMGLAICRKIVDHHGGTIDIDSEPGRGTTVSFTLPADGPERKK
ncbi:sensor histidine kinase [Natronorubrum sp. DTA7]|uniref:sensor histidine kinase n=1 Tax=Natronorubrum sp. DTA7 TaxID=3447016 RepID=UPI003F8295A3